MLLAISIFSLTLFSNLSSNLLVENTAEQQRENSMNLELEPSATKSWTFMIYLDADNNLEDAGIADLNEAESAGSTSQVNIVTQIDRIDGYDTSNGDWKEARRYYVTYDSNPNSIGSTLISNLGEVNMGSSSTLASFIDWAKTNYPANHYALILWDHGSGPMWGSDLGGVCWDETNGDDYLTMTEVYNVLATRHVDLLAFDACLMGSMEIFYQLKDTANVIIGSEKTEPGDGYPYDDILSWLILNPSAPPSQLGSIIVDKYFNSYPSYEAITQTAINTSQLSNLEQKITDLANYLLPQISNHQTEISNARDDAIHFDDEPFLDLYDFCLNLEIEITDNSTITSASEAVRNAIVASIINEEHSSSLSGAHGISIYFPDSIYQYSNDYELLRFCSSSTWDEFIKNFLQPPNNDDSFEENDILSNAATITPNLYQNLRIIDGDSDFFKFSANNSDLIQVYIYFTHIDGGLDIDLYLYDDSGTELDSSESVTNDEYISYTATYSGVYYIEVYPYEAPSSSYSTYDLELVLPIGDDSYEENDNLNSAADITAFINSTVSNLVWQDMDYFKFTLPCDYLVNITVEFSISKGDLDIYLYDENSTLIAYSQTASIERILTAVPYSPGGSTTLYLKIASDRVISNYQIKLFIENCDDSYEPNDDISSPIVLQEGTYLDLVCIDKDYFKVYLDYGESINITILFIDSYGDLDLYLYNPYNDLINSSFSFADSENVFYNAYYSGYYIIEVDPYEINFNYQLIISIIGGNNEQYPDNSMWDLFLTILVSLGIGGVIGVAYSIKSRKNKRSSEVPSGIITSDSADPSDNKDDDWDDFFKEENFF